MATSVTGPNTGVSNYFHPKNIPSSVLHIGPVYGLWIVGFSWSGLLFAIAPYPARMFSVTG